MPQIWVFLYPGYFFFLFLSKDLSKNELLGLLHDLMGRSLMCGCRRFLQGPDISQGFQALCSNFLPHVGLGPHLLSPTWMFKPQLLALKVHAYFLWASGPSQLQFFHSVLWLSVSYSIIFHFILFRISVPLLFWYWILPVNSVYRTARTRSATLRAY